MPAKCSGAESSADREQISCAWLTLFDKGGAALPTERLLLLEQTSSHQWFSHVSHCGHTGIAISAEASKTDGPQGDFE